MVLMDVNDRFWHKRRVLVTGHTGFKGGWLSLWLTELGAEVYGYALAPITASSFWQEAQLAKTMASQLGDIADTQALHDAFISFRPEVVFHLAAQPLVRESYREPAQTYQSNVMGTLNLLEACRNCDSVKAIVVVTTDKCYENREWLWPYRETDALGGHDPYSSSKACAEILCNSWRQSFFKESGVALATARAGNVIGGGDWSSDRLIPDILRAWQNNEVVTLRYPQAVRPWQHVLEPLHGYLKLAQALLEKGQWAAQAWNFGPDSDSFVEVGKVVKTLSQAWGSHASWQVESSPQPHEAGLLALDSSKARMELHWQPRWSLDQALMHTLSWHQAWIAGADMQAFSRTQIALYQGKENE